MMRQRLYVTGLFVAFVCVVASSGNAEARNRCRGGWASGGGWGWRQYNNGYANNGYYGSQNAYTYWNSGTTSGYVNGTSAPVNGPYSVSKPVYADPAMPDAQVQPPAAPQAPNSTIQNAPAPNTVPNSTRPASQAPGTDPTSPLDRTGAPRSQQGGITDSASGK